MKFNSNSWGVILGGSSGFGLATAEKLSQQGMNVCIVHRDRKGNMPRIEPKFEAMRQHGVQVLTYNVNALLLEEMQQVLADLTLKMGPDGRVKMLLHSIAYGNLKLLAPEPECHQNSHDVCMAQLADALSLDAQSLQKTVDTLFNEGMVALANIATPPVYNSDSLLEEEDFTLTVHSMGTSLSAWVQGIFSQHLFADDARVLGLTSEGNQVSWQGYAAVSAAKVALEAVARAIAVEYAPYGIRANIIQAGVTDTPALALIPGNQHLKANAQMRNPYKRLTTPADVANFVYLMCLNEAAWVNGNIIRVDGGEHISG